MKEYQRQIAIEQITKNIAEKESLKIKCQQLENLKNDPKVAEYFALLKEIEELRRKYEYTKTDEKIIASGFKWLIKDEFRCDHEIWLYEGSYYLLIDTFRHEHDDLCAKLDENLPTTRGEFEFRHNSYICLECGKKIEIKDWENFEKNHFVLKNQNTNVDIDGYISQYYQYLYQMPIKEAQEKIIQEFKVEKSKGIAKTLKK